jgi:CheY-like chemotaxis protein
MSNTSILVVDDEPYLVEALKFVLSREGWDIYTASDGEEALQKVAASKPQIMFLDIMMPRKNGYEVCEIIKKIPELKDIYIIMLSAKSMEMDKLRALSLGANDFMSKPYSPKEAIVAAKKGIESLSMVKTG